VVIVVEVLELIVVLFSGVYNSVVVVVVVYFSGDYSCSSIIYWLLY